MNIYIVHDSGAAIMHLANEAPFVGPALGHTDQWNQGK